MRTLTIFILCALPLLAIGQTGGVQYTGSNANGITGFRGWAQADSGLIMPWLRGDTVLLGFAGLQGKGFKFTRAMVQSWVGSTGGAQGLPEVLTVNPSAPNQTLTAGGIRTRWVTGNPFTYREMYWEPQYNRMVIENWNNATLVRGRYVFLNNSVDDTVATQAYVRAVAGTGGGVGNQDLTSVLNFGSLGSIYNGNAFRVTSTDSTGAGSGTIKKMTIFASPKSPSYGSFKWEQTSTTGGSSSELAISPAIGLRLIASSTTTGVTSSSTIQNSSGGLTLTATVAGVTKTATITQGVAQFGMPVQISDSLRLSPPTVLGIADSCLVVTSNGTVARKALPAAATVPNAPFQLLKINSAGNGLQAAGAFEDINGTLFVPGKGSFSDSLFVTAPVVPGTADTVLVQLPNKAIARKALPSGGGGGGISGSGTTNYLMKWLSPTSATISSLIDDGTNSVTANHGISVTNANDYQMQITVKNTDATKYASYTLFNNINSIGQLFLTGPSYAGFPFIGPDALGFYNGASGGIAVYSASDVRFAAGGSQVMEIASSGNVGIGTATPAAKLDVNGTIKASLFTEATDDADAATKGIVVGQIYSTGGYLRQRRN